MGVIAYTSSSSRNDGDKECISSSNAEGYRVESIEKEEKQRRNEGFVEQSPIEQVALTVPTTDDPSIPVLTFRMWILGILSCVLLSFLNQFFCYRSEPIGIGGICAQIVVLPLGRLMATTITRKKLFARSKWEFSLNPGPFSMKEHVLITIFANAGAGTAYAIHIVSYLKIFYKKELGLFIAFLIIITTQMILIA